MRVRSLLLTYDLLRAQDWLTLSFPSRAGSTQSGHIHTAMTYYKQQHILGNAESNQTEKPERFCCYTRSTGLSFKPLFFPKEHQLLSLNSSAVHLQAGKAFTSQRAVSSPCSISCCRNLCGITASLTFLSSNTNTNPLIFLGGRQFKFWMQHL